MNFQIRKEVRILFVLGILLCFPINLLRANLNTIEKTINTIVGSSFTLNPWSDAKSKMSGAICSSTYCNSTDISAFTINAINKTITRYPNYNNQYSYSSNHPPRNIVCLSKYNGWEFDQIIKNNIV